MKDSEMNINLHKAIAKGAGITFSGSVIEIILGLGYSLTLARFLGPEQYGVYTLGLSVLTVLSFFSIAGFHLTAVRFTSMYLGQKDYARLKGLFLVAVIIVLAIAIVLSTVIYLGSSFICQHIFKKIQLTSMLRMFGLLIPLYSVMLLLSFFLRGFQKIKAMVFMRKVLRPLVALVLVWILLYCNFGLSAAISALAISIFISTCYGLYSMVQNCPKEVFWATPVFHFKKLLFFSLPLLFLYFSVNLMNRVDILMLGHFEDSSSIGVYSVANRIARSCFLFYASFNTIFGPILADLYGQKLLSEVSVLFRTTTRWCFTFSLPCVLTFCVFSSDILSLIGGKYAQGNLVLVLLSLMWLIISFCGSIGSFLVMAGFQIQELIFSVMCLLTNIGLNLWLIPEYGIEGAAIATFASVVLLNICKVIYIYAKLRIHPFSSAFVKPLLIGIITGVVLFSKFLFNAKANLGIILFINALFFLAYFLGLYLIGLDTKDQLIFNMVKSKFFPKVRV